MDWLIFVGLWWGLQTGSSRVWACPRERCRTHAEGRTKLAALTKPIHVQVFVTPTCPYCPKVASLAHQAAVENGHVTADVVEISEFSDLAAQYHVRGVPKIVMSDTVELVGAQPEAAFVDSMLRAAA